MADKTYHVLLLERILKELKQIRAIASRIEPRAERSYKGRKKRSSQAQLTFVESGTSVPIASQQNLTDSIGQ